MNKNILSCIALIIVLAFPAAAQFERPAFGPEQAKLAFIVGSFTTATHIPASPMAPNGADGTGTLSVKWGLDSMFVILDEQSKNDLLGNYKGHGVLGFDRRDGKYTLSMFNNFGDTPQYRGNFSGDTLVLMTKVEYPNGSFDQKLVWYKDNNAVRLKIYNDMGSGFTLSIEETSTPSADSKK
ncbi:MAG TPA: DUF1579 family protein [Bacteroidota bacterium]|nr:DUF1579 family protein [Bacteroidota bacterium]